jgi:mRNA interferase MazF
VIQNDAGNTNPCYPNTIVLAMSTKGKRVPFHVRIDPAKTNGLRETTFVRCEQILTVAKARSRRQAPDIRAGCIYREPAQLPSLPLD